MIQKFEKIKKIKGELVLPGDKSISHRSVMLASLAKGKSFIHNLSNSEDVLSTKKCFSQLGASIIDNDNTVEIVGRGFKGFVKSENELYAGNSGTTARLLMGILSGQNFPTVITGDKSLSSRPMRRVIEPLSLMGVKTEAASEQFLPIKIFPPKEIIPINYELPIASAQVKSSILLAGLHCSSSTKVIENIPTRNHTELMLGLKIINNNKKIISVVSQHNYPEANEYFISSDISTASFFIVLTLLTKQSELLLKNISLNETRTGILKVLQEMGGEIEILNENIINGENRGDVFIQSSELRNVKIDNTIIPNIIDEIPILAVAGLFADSAFEIRNASELRKKESDRINSICYNFRLLGLNVNEYEDGFKVEGDIQNQQVIFESFGDHRIAMAFSILSLLLEEGAAVNNFECVKISNPDFITQLKSISYY
ncbi:MAG: 3-phosphoshikimate 1-carboxyvinyltransferase [Ignavibacteriales bacterium]|nr:3-phosphoshikimate 1-carboxyvinyltransferase [Ignavibacteriales bacterium]